jgi:hypothetical protein
MKLGDAAVPATRSAGGSSQIIKSILLQVSIPLTQLCDSNPLEIPLRFRACVSSHGEGPPLEKLNFRICGQLFFVSLAPHLCLLSCLWESPLMACIALLTAKSGDGCAV